MIRLPHTLSANISETRMKCTEFVRKTKQRDASFDCQCVVEMYHEYGFIFSFFLSLSFVCVCRWYFEHVDSYIDISDV